MKTIALLLAPCLAILCPLLVHCGDEETVCEQLQRCCDAIAKQSLTTNEAYYACSQPVPKTEEGCQLEFDTAAEYSIANPDAPPFPDECSL